MGLNRFCLKSRGPLVCTALLTLLCGTKAESCPEAKAFVTTLSAARDISAPLFIDCPPQSTDGGQPTAVISRSLSSCGETVANPCPAASVTTIEMGDSICNESYIVSFTQAGEESPDAALMAAIGRSMADYASAYTTTRHVRITRYFFDESDESQPQPHLILGEETMSQLCPLLCRSKERDGGANTGICVLRDNDCPSEAEDGRVALKGKDDGDRRIAKEMYVTNLSYRGSDMTRCYGFEQIETEPSNVPPYNHPTAQTIPELVVIAPLFQQGEVNLTKPITWTNVTLPVPMLTDDYVVFGGPITNINSEFVWPEFRVVDKATFQVKMRKPITTNECPKRSYSPSHPTEVIQWIAIRRGAHLSDDGVEFEVGTAILKHSAATDFTTISPQYITSPIKARVVSPGEVISPTTEFPVFDAGCCLSADGSFSVHTHLLSQVTDFPQEIEHEVNYIFLTEESLQIDNFVLVVSSVTSRSEGDDESVFVSWPTMGGDDNDFIGAVIGGYPYITGEGNMMFPRLKQRATSDTHWWTAEVNFILDDCYVPPLKRGLLDFLFETGRQMFAHDTDEDPHCRADHPGATRHRHGSTSFIAVLGVGDDGNQGGWPSEFFRFGCRMVEQEKWVTVTLFNPFPKSENGSNETDDKLAVIFSPHSANELDYSAVVYDSLGPDIFRMKLMKPLGEKNCKEHIYQSTAQKERVCWAAFKQGNHTTDEGVKIDVIRAVHDTKSFHTVLNNSNNFFPYIFGSNTPPTDELEERMVSYHLLGSIHGWKEFSRERWATNGAEDIPELVPMVSTDVLIHSNNRESSVVHISGYKLALHREFAVSTQSNEEKLDVSFEFANVHDIDALAVVGGASLIHGPALARKRTTDGEPDTMQTPLLQDQHLQLSAIVDECEIADEDLGTRLAGLCLFTIYRSPISHKLV
eukprot:GHVN01080861.1.p1 GENE.GHVN01080861.1~~GHVN01080861.1.p1  ORF type:complete len:921 (+),score=147.06 GHVN01080861.1:122-2884(+)